MFLEMLGSESELGLQRSLSHELAHAMLHVRVPNCRDLPVWFDEGVATYLLERGTGLTITHQGQDIPLPEGKPVSVPIT